MIRPACPQSFEDFAAMGFALSGVESSTGELRAAKKYRAEFYRRKAWRESRARRAMAYQLAGALGTDHPAVIRYVAALRAVTDASRRSAEQNAFAEICRTWSREKLDNAQVLFDRGNIGPDLDALNAAKDAVNDAGKHYKAAERYAADVARYSKDATLLEAALVARRDSTEVARYVRAAALLDELAARSSLVIDSLEEFAPPHLRPRSSDTFAHAPPGFFATELRRSDRAHDS